MIPNFPPFFSGQEPSSNTPLERYLPPYQPGILPSMLKESGIVDGWILEPIGSHPMAAIDLAQHGYRVFVACNNPILARLYEVICAAPSLAEITAALSELGALKRGDERLELQLTAQYQTTCPKCGQTLSNVTFFWQKDASAPYAKEIDCGNCNLTGEFPVSDQDISVLQKSGNIQLHRTRALQRVLPGSDTPPIAVQEVIDSYLPRALATITTLINKLENLQTTPLRKNILEALIILACDQGNMLWGIGSGRSRPRQISIPLQFKEANLWSILEQGAQKLMILSVPIDFTFYPNLPSAAGGICFYPNRIRKKNDGTLQLPVFRGVATVLPRPNQAFWTYSAVWAGWLWGAESAHQLKGALERRRYDWLWHTNALHRLFNFAAELKLPWFSHAPELSTGYTTSFLAASAASGYQLTHAAYHASSHTAQFYWKIPGKLPENNHTGQIEAIIEYLNQKGEPATYQELFTIDLIGQALLGNLPGPDQKIETTLFNQIQTNFEQKLMRPDLKKIDLDQIEFGEFWLNKPPDGIRPLSDQAELHLIRFLQTNPVITMGEAEQAINTRQPGYLPADRELIQKLLQSYCEPPAVSSEHWTLHPQETRENRQADILEIQQIIRQTGVRLGLEVSGDKEILWKNGPNLEFRFFITASSIISRFFEKLPLIDAAKTILIYPGSRAGLLTYKLKRNPGFTQAIHGIHFIKFRHIRFLEKHPGLNLQTWVQLMDSDPAVGQELNQTLLI